MSVPSPLLVDIYAGDLHGKPEISKLVAAGLPWAGLQLKATQGDYYSGGQWFRTYWPLTRQLAINAGRYGRNFFRGCYHYFDLKVPAKTQADYFLRYVELAGGWDAGDLAPMVDIEASGNPGDIAAAQIVHELSAWSSIVEKAVGAKPILYGGGYLAEHGVTDHCGCQALIVARYTATLPSFVYTRIGWTVDDLLAWQYCGDGQGYLSGYPTSCPMGSTDISVLTIAKGGGASIDYAAAHLLVHPPQPIAK